MYFNIEYLDLFIELFCECVFSKFQRKLYDEIFKLQMGVPMLD